MIDNVDSPLLVRPLPANTGNDPMPEQKEKGGKWILINDN
jgi:hypothetical protein